MVEASEILVEAESFHQKGGWVVDQQFMDQMGSSYLLAHGMGKPVDDATTTIHVKEGGLYYIYVRTYNWTAPWSKKSGPGRFSLSVNGKIISKVLGAEGKDWQWQKVGKMRLKTGTNSLALHDLTGFEGRCDAVYMTTDEVQSPVGLDTKATDLLRKRLYPQVILKQKNYDFIVIGGGIAGMCAAASAARLGCKVALVNDRPVLGGNNSSEVRVHLGGTIEMMPNQGLGRMIREFGHSKGGNAQPGNFYEDTKKDSFILDWRMGREAQGEYHESLAPVKADSVVMGTSIQWYSELKDNKVSFPEFCYGVNFNETNKETVTKGEWTWETGMNKNQITEAERIRDYGLLVIYSNWSFLKNHSVEKKKFNNRSLAWVGYIAGKRESRRLLGDYVLSEEDINKNVLHEDASFTTSWSIDLHFADSINSIHFPGNEFKTRTIHRWIYPYAVPYRCLYSRNVNNLFMAGRNISCTHVALGTVRVMRTTGMMGEVVGMAAGLCHQYGIMPRDVYRHHLPELKVLMQDGLGKKEVPDTQHFNEPNRFLDKPRAFINH